MLDLERRRDEWQNVDTSCRQALALVFIENQEIDQVYEPDTGFPRGTIFPELDKPWCPGGENK